MEAVESRKQDASVNVVSVAGLEPIAATPSLSGGNALLNQPDRRRAAERLREKGWSYRRIAEDLGVPYILVSKWLSDDPAPPDAPLPPRTDAGLPVPDTSAVPAGEHEDPAETIDTLKRQYAALERYMLPMMEALERSRLADMDGTEARAREATERRISELEAAVAALHNQVRTMAVSTAAAGTVAAMTVVDAAATRATDPFAEAPDPFADGAPDPFADVSDPFATAVPTLPDVEADDIDPFADPPAGLATAPDLVAEPVATPFTDTTADPFASAAMTDPFEAGETADPFAEPSDPLGEMADPFAEPAASAFLNEAPDPFAEPMVDPFATAPDPFADPPADPLEEPDASAPKSLGVRLKFWKR